MEGRDRFKKYFGLESQKAFPKGEFQKQNKQTKTILSKFSRSSIPEMSTEPSAVCDCGRTRAAVLRPHQVRTCAGWTPGAQGGPRLVRCFVKLFRVNNWPAPFTFLTGKLFSPDTEVEEK